MYDVECGMFEVGRRNPEPGTMELGTWNQELWNLELWIVDCKRL
jgi:hypothetical protein